jgi:hypothetical protein
MPAMNQTVVDLPDDVESLRAMVAAQATEPAEANSRLHTRDALMAEPSTAALQGGGREKQAGATAPA